jgi:hypothetical protein
MVASDTRSGSSAGNDQPDLSTPSVQLTGYYEFTAVKQDDGWKFSRWIAHIDQG